MAANPRLKDMTGLRFGRWVASCQAGNAPGGGALWRCTCDCGAVHNVLGGDLRAGKSVSCGCLKNEKSAARARTHGQAGTRVYRIWQNMRRRCGNPNTPRFADYGGRGISVCAEWSSFSTFAAWAAVANYADDLSIERIDVNGDYCPGNCCWADNFTQARNRRFVLKREDGKPWSQVAAENGIPRNVYSNRVHNGGWSPAKAATWPLAHRRAGARMANGQFGTERVSAWKR